MKNQINYTKKEWMFLGDGDRKKLYDPANVSSTYHERYMRMQRCLCKPLKHIDDITRSYFGHIGDSKENMDFIKARMLSSSDAESLFIAPPGSGKTYAFAHAFDELIWDYHNAFHVDNRRRKMPVFFIMCPSRIQNIQNAETYHMRALIGGNGIIDFKECQSYSAVYDKAPEIIRALEESDCSGLNINIVIDEAHTLISEYEFRSRAMDAVNDLIALIRELGGNIIYMTATPEPLLGLLDVKEIVKFVDSAYNAPAERLNVVRIKNSKELNFDDQVEALLVSAVEQGRTPFVRVNDIKWTAAMICELKSKGINVVSLDSRDKGIEDEEIEAVDENGKTYTFTQTKYENCIFDSVVRKSCLPSVDKNGQKIDVYFTTSVIECGSNIESIDGIKDENLMPVFIVQKSSDFSLDAMEQFFNRVRFKVKDYNVYIPEQKPSERSLFWRLEYSAMSRMRLAQNIYDGQQAAFDTINNISRSFDGKANTLLMEIMNAPSFVSSAIKDEVAECFEVDKKNTFIFINRTKLFRYAFTRYEHQFFYYQHRGFETLSHRMGLSLLISEYGKKDERYSKKAMRKIHDEAEEDLGIALGKNTTAEEIVAAVENMEETKKEKLHKKLDGIRGSKKITGSMSRDAKNDTVLTAKIAALTGSKKAESGLAFMVLIEKLKRYQDNEAMKYCMKEYAEGKAVKVFSGKTGEDMEMQSIFCLIGQDSKLSKQMKRLITFGASIKEIISVLSECENVNDFKYAVQRYYAGLKGGSLLSDICGFKDALTGDVNVIKALSGLSGKAATCVSYADKEYLFIIQKLFSFNNGTGKFVRKTFTTDDLEIWADEMNESFKTNANARYIAKSVLRLVKSVFGISELEKGKYQIRSLHVTGGRDFDFSTQIFGQSAVLT